MEREPQLHRGRLKLFLGYAAGVGKTYRMLEEGQQLKREGVDVVIGYFEPHGRPLTIALAEGLEQIPRQRIEYRGATFEEMDTDKALARHPAVCLVDELAHTNVPGSARAKRWEDVLCLLDAGIDVLSTMNVQHLESLNDQMAEITGVRVRETVPDWVVGQANEVVMVDVTPEALINRLKRGVVYAPDKAQRALENFFKESTLVALRELALRQTAHELELRHPAETAGAQRQESIPGNAVEPAGEERILVHVTADPSTAMLVRRARRVADFLRADCFAVYVSSRPDLDLLPAAQREPIERYLNFARNLRIETRVLSGEDTAATLLEFARRHRVTQIYLARPQQRGWRTWPRRDLISRVVREGHDMRIAIVAPRRLPAR